MALTARAAQDSGSPASSAATVGRWRRSSVTEISDQVERASWSTPPGARRTVNSLSLAAALRGLAQARGEDAEDVALARARCARRPPWR